MDGYTSSDGRTPWNRVKNVVSVNRGIITDHTKGDGTGRWGVSYGGSGRLVGGGGSGSGG